MCFVGRRLNPCTLFSTILISKNHISWPWWLAQGWAHGPTGTNEMRRIVFQEFLELHFFILLREFLVVKFSPTPWYDTRKHGSCWQKPCGHEAQPVWGWSWHHDKQKRDGNDDIVELPNDTRTFLHQDLHYSLIYPFYSENHSGLIFLLFITQGISNYRCLASRKWGLVNDTLKYGIGWDGMKHKWEDSTW